MALTDVCSNHSCQLGLARLGLFAEPKDAELACGFVCQQFGVYIWDETDIRNSGIAFLPKQTGSVGYGLCVIGMRDAIQIAGNALVEGAQLVL